MKVLSAIVASKRAEIAAARATARRVETTRVPLDVVGALRKHDGRVRLLTEIKFKSPSAGPLSRALDAAERALSYAQSGADMISVLCDGPFFDGGWADVRRARKSLDDRGLPVPLLAKEFIVDALQLDWAKEHGADAALLIARILSPDELRSLVSDSLSRGLEPIVEVVDEAEVEVALATKARVIGVNARDLDTLQMDTARADRVLAAIPGPILAVHLSGIKTAADMRRVASGRADAALVGEVLMRDDDPAPRVADLRRAGYG